MADKPTDPNGPSSPALDDLSSTDDDVPLASLHNCRYNQYNNENATKMMQADDDDAVMTMLAVGFDDVGMVIVL
jgi:hypothetical protein